MEENKTKQGFVASNQTLATIEHVLLKVIRNINKDSSSNVNKDTVQELCFNTFLGMYSYNFYVQAIFKTITKPNFVFLYLVNFRFFFKYRKWTHIKYFWILDKTTLNKGYVNRVTFGIVLTLSLTTSQLIVSSTESSLTTLRSEYKNINIYNKWTTDKKTNI